MARRNRNHIDVKEALELMTDGYSLLPKAFNYYQFRIRAEEHEGFYDWYHTTGTLIYNSQDGYGKNIGTFTDSEECAMFIKNHLNNK